MSTIKETFSAVNFSEAFKVMPVNIKDPKGKNTTAQATPDMMPIILGLPESAQSYRIISGQQAGTFIPAPDLKEFMDKIGAVMDVHIRKYVMKSQELVAQEMGVDIAGLKEKGLDGFQLDPGDPRISQKMIDNIMTELDKAYPTGPLEAPVIQEVIDFAAAWLSDIWEGGDNWKMLVGMVIFNTINQFARSATTIVNEQVIGPLVEIVQYRQYAAQQQAQMQQAAGQRPAMGLVDLTGQKLSTEGINELTLPADAKKDKIVN